MILHCGWFFSNPQCCFNSVDLAYLNIAENDIRAKPVRIHRSRLAIVMRFSLVSVLSEDFRERVGNDIFIIDDRDTDS